MEEMLATLEDDYLVDVKYVTSREGMRTVHVAYDKDTPPPDRYACPIPHCTRGGFNLAAVLAGIVRPRVDGVIRDAAADPVIDKVVETECEERPAAGRVGAQHAERPV